MRLGTVAVPSDPDTALILRAPIGVRPHTLSVGALFAVWPFSRLVHVFSAPAGYLTGPDVVYRSRVPASTAAGRGGVGSARGSHARRRSSARTISGAPTRLGTIQYATVGSRSHTGNWWPLST